MNDADVAWAAGVIEGEGCIRIATDRIASETGGKRHRALLLLIVGMADGAVVHRLKATFGGHVSLRKDGMWIWIVSAAAAMRTIQAVRPHMVGDKCRQADLAVEFQALRRISGRGGKLAHEIERDEDYARRLSAMKPCRKKRPAAPEAKSA